MAEEKYTDKEKMISSKEILRLEGISRATLNNYIKLGILPRPIVRRPVGEKGGPKQMGYFPSRVSEIFRSVNAMKSEGDSMEMIAMKLRSPSGQFSVRVLPVDSGPARMPSESLSLFSDLLPPSVHREVKGRGKRVSAGVEGEISPALLDLGVLVAVIEDWEQLRNEWSPEEFFARVKRVWVGVEEAVAKNRGVINHRHEGVFTAFFSSEGNTEYIKAVFRAALDTQKLMERLSRNQRSVQKTHRTELYLNMGLSVGKEYLEMAEGLGYLTSPGFALADATALARFGQHGSIWASKDILCRLAPEEGRFFRYGVARHGVFEERAFSRLRDLLPAGRQDAPHPDDFHDRLIAAEILHETG